MGRYATSLYGVGYTDVELDIVRNYDYVIIQPSSFSSMIDPTLISRVKSKIGNGKILAVIEASWASLSGSAGRLRFSGAASDPYPVNLPYDPIKFLQAQRCYTQNQYAVTAAGGLVTGTLYGTGWALADFTNGCPRGSDGFTYSEWLSKFLLTGVIGKYDVDGLLFDNLDYINSWFTQSKTVDLNRDGSVDTSGGAVVLWSGGINSFLSNLRTDLDNIGRTDIELWFNGNFPTWNNLNGKYYPSFISPADAGFSAAKFNPYYIELTQLQASGKKSILNARLTQALTSRTNFVGLNAASRLMDDFIIGTTMLFSGTYFHISNYSKDSLFFDSYIHKNYKNPLTEIIQQGKAKYRVLENGIAILNTGALNTSETVFNYKIIGLTGLVISDDNIEKYYVEDDTLLGHGFEGVLGIGVGKHLNHPSDLLDYKVQNKWESALNQALQQTLRGTGKFVLSGGYYDVCEIFTGNGSQTEFEFSRGINEWGLSLVSETGTKHAYSSFLTKRNPYDNLFYSITFTGTAIPTGVFAVIYQDAIGSMLDSNAYLE